MPATYASLIEATRDCLARRARRYRWTVLTIVAVIGGSVILTIFRSPRPGMSILAGLPVAVAWFVCLDRRMVIDWTSSVLEGWVAGNIDVPVFVTTLAKVPGLPARTLEGMTRTLPAFASRLVPGQARAGLSALIRRREGLGAGLSAITLAAWTIVALVALFVGFGGPPASLLAAPVLWLSCLLFSVAVRRRQSAIDADLAACIEQVNHLA